MKKARGFLYILVLFIFSLLIGKLHSSEATETEINVALTEKNYQLLLQEIKKHAPEIKEREDFYFDLYQDRRFVLAAQDFPIKLRLMKNKKEIKWQVLKQLKKGNVFPFIIKETMSAEVKIKLPNTFLALLRSFHEDLENRDVHALEEAKSIEEVLHNEGLIKKSLELCSQCSPHGPYYLTHYNFKERFNALINLESEIFSLSIGRTINDGEWSYELEAELADKSDPVGSAKKLQNWMLQAGYLEQDLPSPKIDPAQKSLTLLNQLFSL